MAQIISHLFSNHVTGNYDLRASDRYYVTPSTTSSNESELRVRGDIIAFAAAASDDKLKTNKINITGALDKVNSLNGFTFEWNEVGDKILDIGDMEDILVFLHRKYKSSSRSS